MHERTSFVLSSSLAVVPDMANSVWLGVTSLKAACWYCMVWCVTVLVMISELGSCLCMHAWLGNQLSDLLLKEAIS